LAMYEIKSSIVNPFSKQKRGETTLRPYLYSPDD